MPDRIYAMRAQRLRTVLTEGDGTCSLHSVFGVCSSGGLRLWNARGFLAGVLGSSAVALRAHANDDALVGEMAFVLWNDIVKPQARASTNLPVGAHALGLEAG